jgi:hypothetical protein
MPKSVALRYNPAGRGFDSRWWHWNFSVTWSFRLHYGPGVDSAYNRNEYQVYFLGVKAAGAQGWQPYHHPVPLSWNLGILTSWNPLGHSRPVTGLLYLYLIPKSVRRLWVHMNTCVGFLDRICDHLWIVSLSFVNTEVCLYAIFMSLHNWWS